jgi:hypothetical protein
MPHMAKKKTTEPDRHRPHKMVRLDLDVHEAVAEVAAENDRAISREIRRLLIEQLKQLGKWPPSKKAE